MAKILTQRSVDAAQPRAKRYGVRDGLTPGLRLIVHPSGQKTFALFARVNGRLVNTKIGSAACSTWRRACQGRRFSPGLSRAKTRGWLNGTPTRLRRTPSRSLPGGSSTLRQDQEQDLAGCRAADRARGAALGRRPITSITADVVALLDAIMDRARPVRQSHACHGAQDVQLGLSAGRSQRPLAIVSRRRRPTTSAIACPPTPSWR